MGTLTTERGTAFTESGGRDVMNKVILDPLRVYEIQMNGNHSVCLWLYSVFLTRRFELVMIILIIDFEVGSVLCSAVVKWS